MPNNFLQYNISDFAADESFKQWVLDLASTHRPFWEKYIADHPQQTDKILAAKELIAQLHRIDVQLTDPELAQAIWKTIRERTRTNTPERPARQLRWGPYWRVAATLLLAAGLGLVGWQWQLGRLDRAIKNVPDNLIEEMNHTSTLLRVHLSDGSVVNPGKNSRLSYPQKFTGPNRITYLEGKALFTVVKQPEQPFLVYTQQTLTRAIGTRFSIQAHAEAANERILVQEGRVSVVAKASFEEQQPTTQVTGLVLTPNQQAIYEKATARLGKTLSDTPVLIKPSGQPAAFVFVNTPVETVIGRLAEAYAISIVYEPDTTDNQLITANLTNLPFYDQLKTICKTASLTYQLIDGQVIMSHIPTKFLRRQN